MMHSLAVALVSAFAVTSLWSVESFCPPVHPRPASHHPSSTPKSTALQSAPSPDASIVDNTWRSDIRSPAASSNPIEEAKQLCQSTPCRSPDASRGESGLAFLFVSQKYAGAFEDIVSAAHQTLGADTTLLSIVGGGVIGGGKESDDPAAPAMSLLSGILPASAGVEVFMFGPDEAPPPPASEAWNAIGRGQDVPSYILFCDPFSKLQEVISGLDASGNSRQEGSAVVAGGISCPTFGDDGPTVAINGKAYPRGTAIGVGLSGTLGLQAVVAQGCRPIGMAYEVTEAEGNLIVTLDGKPAVEVLAEIAEGDHLSQEDRKNIQTYGVMCGLATPGAKDVMEGDYLIRQILGFRAPAVMIGAEVKQGDLLKFHVRDPTAALEDLQNMIGRAKSERLFAGGATKAGTPLAALQVSCVARGRSLFGTPNVDVQNVQSLVGEEAAVGGFFANGEIGPVGIAGRGMTSKATHMHGFTTVACTICKFGAPSTTTSLSSTQEIEEDAWG